MSVRRIFCAICVGIVTSAFGGALVATLGAAAAPVAQVAVVLPAGDIGWDGGRQASTPAQL